VLTVVIVVLATGDDEGSEATMAGPTSVASGSLAEMEAAVAAQPENNAMRLVLAQMYFDSGDYMNAMNQYSTVTANDPTPQDAATANAHIGWMAWVALDDPETALAFLDAALAADPAYGEATLWKGIVLLYGMEDGPSAVPLFEQVLGLSDLPDALRPEVEALLEEARGGTP
jgi:tetratricopeptide (TPR) repeat protein